MSFWVSYFHPGGRRVSDGPFATRAAAEDYRDKVARRTAGSKPVVGSATYEGLGEPDPCCAICGGELDGGHMAEACTDESEEECEAREGRERENKPTRMPTAKGARVHVSRCHGATLEGALSDGVLVGVCSTCREVVARTNPRTGMPEWLNGASPWTPEDAT